MKNKIKNLQTKFDFFFAAYAGFKYSLPTATLDVRNEPVDINVKQESEKKKN